MVPSNMDEVFCASFTSIVVQGYLRLARIGLLKLIPSVFAEQYELDPIDLGMSQVREQPFSPRRHYMFFPM